MTKTKNRKQDRKQGRKQGKKTKTKTKRMAGFVPERARTQLASIELRLAPIRLGHKITNIIDILREKLQQYEDYKESIYASFDYNHKKIPSISINLMRQINQVLERVKYLIRLHDQDGFLEEQVRIRDYAPLNALIDITISNMETLEDNMQRYTQSSRDDYTKTQLGLEPFVVNKISRMADAIIRNPGSVRTTALTRRIRSR